MLNRKIILSTVVSLFLFLSFVVLYSMRSQVRRAEKSTPPQGIYTVWVIRDNGRKASRKWASSSPVLTPHGDGVFSSEDVLTGNRTYYRLNPGEQMLVITPKDDPMEAARRIAIHSVIKDNGL